MKIKLIDAIKQAVYSGILKEPFSATDVKKACPGWARRTYSNFLSKHRKGNPGGYSEYFLQSSDGSYNLLADSD